MWKEGKEMKNFTGAWRMKEKKGLGEKERQRKKCQPSPLLFQLPPSISHLYSNKNAYGVCRPYLWKLRWLQRQTQSSKERIYLLKGNTKWNDNITTFIPSIICSRNDEHQKVYMENDGLCRRLDFLEDVIEVSVQHVQFFFKIIIIFPDIILPYLDGYPSFLKIQVQKKEKKKTKKKKGKSFTSPVVIVYNLVDGPRSRLVSLFLKVVRGEDVY